MRSLVAITNALALALTFPCSALAQQDIMSPQRWVGSRLPSAPLLQLVYIEGAWLGDVGEYSYGLQAVSATVTGKAPTMVPSMLWLDRRPRLQESALTETRAVLGLPLIGEDEIVLFGMYTCMVDKKFDKAVIAVVKYEDVEVFSKVLAAWRVDVATESFREMPTLGITCANDGYGH